MNCDAVLIVEDDESIREVLQQILEWEGYLVHTAENGQQALDVLAQVDYPCLILLDLMMPVMNGWQFLAARKKNRLLADLPVVVLSAVAEQARDSGATQLMSKVPDIDSLLAAVKRYCRPAPPPKYVAGAA